ncbi:MAG TPA: hypothetical protein VIA09_05260 [Nitrososphaeraceae archaeon]
MSEDTDSHYPSHSRKDKLIEAGKTVSSIGGSIASIATGFPLLNVAATELFKLVFIPSIDKRRAEFINRLADRLTELELKIDDLANNPLFVTVVTQSLLIALRSHQEEKLEALRNAVINTAKPLFADDNTYLMFLNCVDAFTPWHIRVLNHLKSNETPIYDLDGNELPILKGPLTEEIRKKFPANEFDGHLIRQVFNDLSSRGFIKIGLLSSSDEGDVVDDAKLTTLGLNFIRFIES